ncbi:hypothetical protein GRF29_8g683109 [Pseudopithomyces chartarum]|uniref:Uncharacterized protein n=1 Tax=Pseudopithomyces chartarum TaxID=1892770 RepID=A0AAN6M7N1_9PLEO|nr:hypothetical protein GRF29_8g683109 [Pseudopithomyces chartarum]
MSNYLLLVLLVLGLSMAGAVPQTVADPPHPVSIASGKDLAGITFSDKLASVDIPPVATLQLCGAMDFHQPCVDIAFFKHECQNTDNVWPGHSILSARPMQSAWCYMYPVPDCLSLDEDGKRPIFLKWGINDFGPYNGKIASWICFPQ